MLMILKEPKSAHEIFHSVLIKVANLIIQDVIQENLAPPLYWWVISYLDASYPSTATLNKDGSDLKYNSIAKSLHHIVIEEITCQSNSAKYLINNLKMMVNIVIGIQIQTDRCIVDLKALQLQGKILMECHHKNWHVEKMKSLL